MAIFIANDDWFIFTYAGNNKIKNEGVKFLCMANWPNLTDIGLGFLMCYLENVEMDDNGVKYFSKSNWLNLSIVYLCI